MVKMPHEVTMTTIPRMNDLRGIWRQGLQQLEIVFQDHISQMNVEFDAKAIEFDKIREQLVINYEFLQRFYVDMQRKLNEKND